jgi:hypothetical protein
MTYLSTPRLKLDRQFVFDLNDVIGQLQVAVFTQDEHKHLAGALIVDHLYEYHYLDVDGFLSLPQREHQRILELGKSGGNVLHALHSGLWHAFRLMSFHVHNARHFSASLKHNVLTVKVYN